MAGMVAGRFSPVETKRFIVRVLEQADVSSAYLSWFDDPEIMQFIQAARQPQNLDKLKAFVRDKLASDQALLLGIFARVDRRHIGNIKFEPIDLAGGAAVLGVMIGDAAWRGKGVFQEVFAACAQRLATDHGIRTIALGADEANQKALRAYLEAGFEPCRNTPPRVIRRPRPGCVYLVYHVDCAITR